MAPAATIATARTAAATGWSRRCQSRTPPSPASPAIPGASATM